MQKTMELHYREGNYILKNSKNESEEFVISEETLQFDTVKFYESVFANIGEYAEIEVINKVVEEGTDVPKDKQITKMVFETIEQICSGVAIRINENIDNGK